MYGPSKEDLIAIFARLLSLERPLEADIDKGMACAFCNRSVDFGQSLCADCMRKYNIRSIDLANDGCGCDK